MPKELNTLVNEVIIDDSQALPAADRVISKMDAMAASQDRAAAASGRQASGFDLLNQAEAKLAPAQESALRRLDSWRAKADPVERSLQQLSRAERDWNRAISQGLATENEKTRNLDMLWDKLLGAAEAQEKLNAAMRAQDAQAAYNAQLGVKDDFNATQRAADVAAYGQELDRLQQRYAPLAAAQANFEREIEQINQAQRTGAITAQEAATALKMNEGAYRHQVNAIQQSQKAIIGHTGAVKLQSWQVAQFWQQMQDIFIQMQMGTNPFTILAQQGPQVTTAMGGVRNSLALVLSVITPTRLALAALAGTTALVLTRTVSLQNEERGMSAALRAWGKDAEISASQVHKLVEEMRDLGVAKGEAQTALKAAFAIPGASGAAIENAAGLAPDFASGFGVSVEEATRKIVEMETKGYPAIRKLDEAYQFLTDDQAKLIRDLVDHGEQAAALNIAYDALTVRIKGVASDAMSPLGRSIKDTKREWGDLRDAIAGSGAAVDLVESLNGGLSSIAGLFRGDLTSAWDGWVTHVTNDPAFSLIQGFVDGWLKLGEWTSGISNSPPTSDTGTPYDKNFAQFRREIGADSFGGDPAIRNQVKDQIDAYEREMDVLSRSSAIRDAYRAQQETLIAWRRKGAEETDAQAVAEKAYQAALARSMTAVTDNIRLLDEQASAQTAIAAAYEVSIKAGKDEEIAQKARIATLGLGKDAALKMAAAERELADATAHTQAVVDHAKAAMDAEIAARKARAAMIVDPTLKHEEELAIERQVRLNEVTEKYRGNVDDINRAMADFDRQKAYEEQERFWNDVGDQARQYSDDIRSYLLDGITNATDGGKAAFDDLWETARAGLKRFLVNAALTAAENAIVVPILTDVVGSNSGLFGIVAPSGGAGGAGAAANAATGGGGIGDLFSLGNGGILSGFDSLLSYNSTLGNSFVTGSVGQWLGLSTPAASGIGPVSVSGAGQALAGLGNILGSGGIGYGVGSLYGALGLGNSTGSSIGGALGGAIGSIIPGVGTIIGSIAGSVIGGFFGNDQPSDMFAQTSFDLRAGEVSGTYYNPAEFSQANLDASGNLIDSFSQIAMQIEALTGGVLPESAFAKVGSRDGIVVGVGEAGIGVNTPQFGDTASFANSKSGAEKALNFMVEALAKQITDIEDADYKRILEMGGSGEDILANLDVAAQIKALGQTESVNQAEEQLQTLIDTFEELRAKAIELQLAVEDVNDAEAQQLRNLEQGVRTNFAATVHGYIDQFLTPLQALQETISTSGQSTYEKFQAAQSLFRDVAAKAADGNEVALGLLDEAGKNYADLARNLTGATAPLRNFLESLNSGSLSNLTPREQLAAAQGSFDELSARALAGDSSVMGDLAQAAQDYLTLARDYGASGSVYQQAYEQVTGSLNQIVDVVDGAIGSVDPTSVLDEINTAISPLIDQLVASEAEILAGIEPTLDDLNGNFLLNIETLKDEGDQTRELLADIATALGAVPGQATGGLVTGMGGPTSDSNLRRLSAGEYVNTASAVTRFGVGFFDALNSGYVPAVSMPSNDNSGTTAAIGQLSDISTQGFNGLARVFREELADLRRSVDELAKETSRNRQYASIQAKR
ncbi:hypothetical protein FHS78_000612 [Parvibaculum indicum]|uniref:phage tail length tape measure family protein n=1 Tax=Parvibaculum indicum TaxID=562969 RepID=UPI00141E2EA0|nr:phage tail length tape measure family protein [Parvibaculum indicum]NIJ40342.1 hypothetical protein [Parvibaculum indicum]